MKIKYIENSKVVQVLCTLAICRLNFWNPKSEVTLDNLVLFKDVDFLDRKR